MDHNATDERIDRPEDRSAPKMSTASEDRTPSPDSASQFRGQSKPSTRKKLKQKAIDLVTPSKLTRSAGGDDEPPLNHVRLDAAFNPSKVEKEMSPRSGKAARLADRSRSAVEDSVDFVKNPKKAIRNKIKQSATSRFTPALQPYASKTDELENLNAQEPSNSTDAASGSVSEAEVDSKIRGERLEERRDSIRTAWITSHMRRIRVLREQPQPLPSRESCKYWDEEQQTTRVHWMRWAGHLALYLTQSFTPLYTDPCEELPYDLASMRAHTERLLLAGSHWQAWVMDVRSVYRWEDPSRTARWLALYVVLWYTSLIMTFFWVYIIYHVVSNRFQKRTLENVRKAARRAMNRETTAYQLGEMIDRLGQEEGINELLRDLGPYVQLQMDDMANALEVVYNFYAWKAPQKTIWTLVFFGSCLACCLFSDTEYCMKIIWFLFGISFFFCWPISSNYPKFRLLVSPLKWIFWGIPSHANLSFIFLRKHAELHRQDLMQKRLEHGDGGCETHVLDHYAGKLSTTNPSIPTEDQNDDTSAYSSDDDDWESAVSGEDDIEEGDLLNFRAHSEGLGGRMYISSDGIRFDRNHPREKIWEVRWEDLDEVWKAGLHGHRKITMHGLFDSGILQLKHREGHVYTLDPIKYRDEAFNCIIGFSRLQWQVVQTEPGKGRRPKEEKKPK